MKNYKDTHIKKITDCVQEAYIKAEEDNYIDIVVKRSLKKIMHKVTLTQDPITEKISNLQYLVRCEIKELLLTYDRSELMITLLGLKAFLRTQISSDVTKNEDYEISNRHEEILCLLLIALSSCVNEFQNRSLIDGTKNLAVSFRLSYYYNVLNDNLECYLAQSENLDTRSLNLFDFFEEGAFYTEEYNNYMDDVLMIGLMENPDDMNISTLSIKEQMKIDGINIEKIKEDIDIIIKRYFGFSISNLNHFTCWGLKQKPAEFLIIKDKMEYFKLIEKEFNGSYSQFNNIIKTFSLNSLMNKKGSLNDLRHIELRSIFELENIIIFYPFDLTFNCSCFEKFMLKNHFVNYYSVLLDSNEQEELNKQLSMSEKNISTYLAYVIADQLYTNGYKLPMKNNSPYVEIDTILVNNHINLLKDKNMNKGDIDVLALDEARKEIYNIEIKYYKPLHHFRDTSSTLKIKEREKNMIGPKKRAHILKENIKEVIEFLGGQANEIDGYSVRTVFVTPRPDYWLSYAGKGIEYYTWVDFINRINSKLI